MRGYGYAYGMGFGVRRAAGRIYAIGLSNGFADLDAAVGTKVGTLSVPGSSLEWTFTLLDDADGQFVLDGDDVEVADTLADGLHEIEVEAEKGGVVLGRTFTIAVGTASGFEFAALDNISSICFLKRVRAGYLGPLVRLRRSSDNAEQDFAGKLIFDWFLDKGEIEAWLNGANANIVTVYDQSGEEAHASHDTAGNQPALDLTTDHPSVRFSQSGQDYLNVAALDWSRNASALTMLAVAKQDDLATSGNNRFLLAAGNPAGAARAVLWDAGGAGAWQSGGRRLDDDSGQFTTGLTRSTDWAVRVARYDYAADTIKHRANSVSETLSTFQTGSTGQNTSDTASLAVRWGAPSGASPTTNLFNGVSYGMALIRDYLTDQEEDDLVAALTGFFSELASSFDGALNPAQINPNAISYAGRTIIGAAQHNGNQVVVEVSEATRQVVAIITVCTAYSRDDHNAPAVLVTEVGTPRFITLYTGHNDDAVMRYRIGTTHRIASRGDEQTLDMSAVGDCTYARLFEHSSGDVYAIYRSGNWSWCLAVLEAESSEFVYLGRIVTDSPKQIYMTTGGFLGAGDELRFISHSAEQQPNVRVGTVNVVTGVITSGSGEVGNVLTDNPVDIDDLTVLHEVSGASRGSPSIFPDGRYIITASVSGTITYYYGRLTGSDWNDPSDHEINVVGSNSVPIAGSSESTHGGIQLSRESGLTLPRVYIGQRSGDTSRMEQWDAADEAGSSWSVTRILDSIPLTTKGGLYRPYSPFNASAAIPVIWGEVVNRNNYNSWNSATVKWEQA